MALVVMHIFSSNYEKNAFDSLAVEISKLAHRYSCRVEEFIDTGIRYQRLFPTTERQLKTLRSGLKTLQVNYALMK